MAGPGTENKVLIMAGGTGGHVFPALSIAEYLRGRGMSVEWLGTRRGLEARVIPARGLPIHYISIGGLRGKSLLRRLAAPVSILTAIMQAIMKVLSIKPRCVLGMGGFATGPGGIAAWLLGRKLVIHEQNAVAGLTNQLLFPFASCVMEAFPGAFARKRDMTANALLRSLIKPEKVTVVGNPVREDILGLPAPEERFREPGECLKVLVIGGSLGSVAINEVVPAALARIPEASRPAVWHQCGDRHREQTLAFYRQAGIELDRGISVVRFIDDMAEAYCWADLIICRAGAVTVSEIAAVGLASVLIPFPFAVDDHQTENARVLVDAGAAYLVQQRDLTAEVLENILEHFINNREGVLKFALAARSVARPRAAELAGEKCLEVCHV